MLILIVATPAAIANAAEKAEAETVFVVGAALGDGSLGFKEPWSEVFVGLERSRLKNNNFGRELSFRLGLSPTDKEYSQAISYRANFQLLEEIRENIWMGFAIRGSRLETDIYTKNTVRGEFIALRQFALNRFGGKILMPISDENDLRGIGITLEAPLARESRGWLKYRAIFVAEILQTEFAVGDRREQDTVFRMGLTLRL